MAAGGLAQPPVGGQGAGVAQTSRGVGRRSCRAARGEQRAGLAGSEAAGHIRRGSCGLSEKRPKWRAAGQLLDAKPILQDPTIEALELT